MKSLLALVAFLDVVQGIRRTSPSNIYPGSSSGIDLSQIRPNTNPRPSLVWSSTADSPNRSLVPKPFRTDKSNWERFDEFDNSTVCHGYLRYGNEVTYSNPIAISGLTKCEYNQVRDFLWSTPVNNATDVTCQCRQGVPMYLTKQYQNEIRCLAKPSSDNGWPVPGLVNCTDYSDQVTRLVYHPFSGQIRTATGGECLTAMPYRTAAPGNMTGMWKPWSVKFMPCLNYIDPKQRQAWDVPEGVGEIVSDQAGRPPLVNAMNEPSGHVGRIVLRDSSDVGVRCLDIAYEFPPIPSKIPAVFMEAMLCSDLRLSMSDYSLWRFYRAPLGKDQEVARLNQWALCKNAACADCGDGELRALLKSPGTNVIYTEPLSMPFGLRYGQMCNLDMLRKIAVPEKLSDATDRKCYCQAHNYFESRRKGVPLISSIIMANADDLPTTVRPGFMNVTKSTVVKKY